MTALWLELVGIALFPAEVVPVVPIRTRKRACANDVNIDLGGGKILFVKI